MPVNVPRGAFTHLMVIDTNALIAMLNGESEAERFEMAVGSDPVRYRQHWVQRQQPPAASATGASKNVSASASLV